MKRHKSVGAHRHTVVQPSIVIDPDGDFDDSLSARQYLSQQYGICPNCLVAPCLYDRHKTDYLSDIVLPVLVTLSLALFTVAAVIFIFSF